LTLYQKNKQQKERIEQAQALKADDEEQLGVWEFSLYNEKDAKLAALLLDQNKIKYSLEVF
jgi:hypothetical protein